jgi:DNA ligase-1
MLAAICDDPKALRFPVWATPKIDGIRAFGDRRMLMSRSLKPIPNKFVQDRMAGGYFDTLDGELDLKSVSLQTHRERGTQPPTFQDVSSAFMTQEGEPDFIFRIFDVVMGAGYLKRMDQLRQRRELLIKVGLGDRCDFLFPVEIKNLDELQVFADDCMAKGHEGAMIRTPDGPYKGLSGANRSTFKEQYLVKIKPLEDDEATIVGFEQAMENTNPPTINALGHTERSSHKAGMIPKDTLGALVCKSDIWVPTFNIGTGIGFDARLKYEIWTNPDKYLGKVVKYRYQKIGSLDKPRQPSFLGFRDPLDRSVGET